MITLIIFAATARLIAPFFNSNPAVISVSVTCLWIVSISFGFQGVVLLAKTVLNVLDKPIAASLLTIVQMFVLYIPLAYSGSYLFGVSGIFGASVVANITAGIVGYMWLKRNLITDENSSVIKARDLAVAKRINQESLP